MCNYDYQTERYSVCDGRSCTCPPEAPSFDDALVGTADPVCSLPYPISQAVRAIAEAPSFETKRSADAMLQAAADDRMSAITWRQLAKNYSGDVHERMLVLAEYHSRRAEAAEWCAKQFEKMAARGWVRT